MDRLSQLTKRAVGQPNTHISKLYNGWTEVIYYCIVLKNFFTVFTCVPKSSVRQSTTKEQLSGHKQCAVKGQHRSSRYTVQAPKPEVPNCRHKIFYFFDKDPTLLQKPWNGNYFNRQTFWQNTSSGAVITDWGYVWMFLWCCSTTIPILL